MIALSLMWVCLRGGGGAYTAIQTTRRGPKGLGGWSATTRNTGSISTRLVDIPGSTMHPIYRKLSN